MLAVGALHQILNRHPIVVAVLVGADAGTDGDIQQRNGIALKVGLAKHAIVGMVVVGVALIFRLPVRAQLEHIQRLGILGHQIVDGAGAGVIQNVGPVLKNTHALSRPMPGLVEAHIQLGIRAV